MIMTVGGVGTAFMVARAKMRAAAPPPPPPHDTGEVAELRDSVHRLTADVADLQERVDFAERLLSAQREPGRLKGE